MSQIITRDELHRRINAGDVLLIVEALPASDYEDAHLPGARNLPHDAGVDEIAAVLPHRDAEVIVYCSNLPCPNSTILTRRLEQLGYTNAREYAEGKQDWIEAGLPVEGAAVHA
jgi:rhodanese-related sulfurtransferase